MVKLFSKISNLCDHNSPTLQTDGQTDGQTTCDRNTALCTKVHRAVIKQVGRDAVVYSEHINKKAVLSRGNSAMSRDLPIRLITIESLFTLVTLWQLIVCI